jgi:NAD(P)H-dependent flavin oxidoreductase YrpB (nitropropane dioxygenase family)
MTLPAVLTDNFRLPVVAAPLFIISHPPLVMAQCKAGVMGSFPALNARPESQLDEWLAEITEGWPITMQRIRIARQRLSPSTRSSTAPTSGSNTT